MQRSCVFDQMLLVKYKNVWREIKSIIGRANFDSDPVFDDKYSKTKIKF